MIYIVRDSEIIAGPFELGGALSVLFALGFTLEDGYLVMADPDGTLRRLCEFPPVDPIAQMQLPGGVRICPAVQVEEPVPEGMMQAGTAPVFLADRVELRPVWVPVPPPPSLEEVKAAKKAEATAMRDQVRAGGVLFGSVRLAALPEDQGTYGDSITYLGWKPEGTTLKWKAASGWITVDLPTLRAAAEAVGDFIEALFEAEHVHHAAIDALESVEAVQAYDITIGWPGQTSQEGA